MEARARKPISPSVGRMLGADHAWMNALLADAIGAARDRDESMLAARLEALVQGLRNHLRAENGVLFPAYERTPGAVPGVVDVLRREHAAIEVTLDETWAMAMAVDPGLPDALERLRAMLEAHEQREEAWFFPCCDRTVPAIDRVATVRELDRKVPG